MYKCNKCNYLTNFSSHYEKHMSSNKHKVYNCNICNKPYKTRSGLWKHNDKMHNKNPNENNNALIELSNTDKQIDKITQILEKTINNQNNKTTVLENIIIKQEKIINDLIPKVGNTINNKISINVFLEQNCANAINFNDFLKQIKVNLDDLYITKELGYVDGISNIFMENMSKLSIHERPIHCTDVKRETLYIKSGGDIIDGKSEPAKWKKDDNNKLLKQAIHKAGHIQIKNLNLWKEKHPNWETDSDAQTDYMILVRNSTDDFKEKRREEKVIKNICNNVYIKEGEST